MWQRAITACRVYLVWVTASILSGYQAILAGLEALVGVWEESTRSVIRESSLQVQRAINGFSARVLSGTRRVLLVPSQAQSCVS